jgi:hypothetical protein
MHSVGVVHCDIKTGIIYSSFELQTSVTVPPTLQTTGCSGQEVLRVTRAKATIIRTALLVPVLAAATKAVKGPTARRMS